MSRTAIVEPAITALVAETRDLIEALNAANDAVEQLDKKLVASREIQKARRIELGMLLRKARQQLPSRGTATNGWLAYLEAIEMPETTAARYMQEAGALVSDRTSPQLSKVGTSDHAYESTPPPSDEDAPAPEGVEQPVVVDRGGWCTPKKWADAVGPWDLDAFSNPRSHIVAPHICNFEGGDDGFGDGSPGSYRIGDVLRKATKKTRFWGQPDYRNGFVERAIDHYGHTRFCFLLRLDTSTVWFERLWSISELIMIPRGERIEFEPPPGVEPSSNPYPHGFYYRSAEDVTDAVRAACFEWRISR